MADVVKVRKIHADVKEVKTTSSKGTAKKEDEPVAPPA
jgi:hypothetical protein